MGRRSRLFGRSLSIKPRLLPVADNPMVPLVPFCNHIGMCAPGELTVSNHQASIETITTSLRGVAEIDALFLSGSLAKGRGDAWSDIDFVIVTKDGPTDQIAAFWRDAIARTGEIVLWRDRSVRPMLINAITADWTRIDGVIVTPEGLGAYPQDGLLPLFDPQNLYAELPVQSPPTPSSPARFTYEIEEFIRILGLLHLVVGREEYLNGVLGLFHLRNLLVELLIAETGVPDRGGVLHLNRLITTDQQAVLRGLPPPVPEKEALIAAHQSYANVYLPRARVRAAKLGLPWPEAFEAATWRKLSADVGLTRPY